MPKLGVLVVLAMLGGALGVPESSRAVTQPQEMTLCAALEAVQPGQRLELIVEGVYVVGMEDQLFYDPGQPTCFANVQPFTWVEFVNGVDGSEALERQLKIENRVFVTFVGELYGPGLVGVDELKLAPNVAFANRTSGRRYGHLNQYRTKLVVNRIASVSRAPSELAGELSWKAQPSTSLCFHRRQAPTWGLEKKLTVSAGAVGPDGPGNDLLSVPASSWSRTPDSAFDRTGSETLESYSI